MVLELRSACYVISSLPNCYWKLLLSFLTKFSLHWQYIPEQIGAGFHSDQTHIFRYYIQPCIFLFNGSDRLLFHVLKLFYSSIIEDNLPGFGHVEKPLDRFHVICSILIFLHNDVRLHKSLSLCKVVIKSILQNVLSVLVSHGNRSTNILGYTSVALVCFFLLKVVIHTYKCQEKLSIWNEIKLNERKTKSAVHIGRQETP